MPRFVILEHDHPVLHWDLMLEAGETLRTWRLAIPPQPGQRFPAIYLAHHRRLYLDYEGPLSGNRGRVVRWDSGTFNWQLQEEERVTVYLRGGRFQGSVLLERDETMAWTCVVLP